MSQAQSPSISDYLNAAYWAYAQAGTPYPDGDTALPSGFSYLLVNGAPLINYTPSTGFYAAALVTGGGQVVVAIEGTNLYTGNGIFTLAQTLDDGAITAGIPAASYYTAECFTRQVITDAGLQGYASTDVFLAGHSLGGADAEYVAAKLGLGAGTFGAPGIPSDSFSTNTPAVTDYVERGDPVGNYAMGGNEDPLLKAGDVVHYGTTDYTGSYLGTAALVAASVAYEEGDYALSTVLVSAATVEYHPLERYATDLGVPIGSPTLTASAASPPVTGTLGLGIGQAGGTDIPGLDIAAPGAVTLSAGSLQIAANGTTYTLPLNGNGATFSLQSDGQGGTLLTPGAATGGYVFAGAGGATIGGGSAPLVFVGGNGPVSVIGGSGATTMFGGGGSAVLIGGSGTNLVAAGAGSSTLVGGAGASTLIGGSGGTLEFAEGAAPTVLIGGAGATTIDGLTGSGPEAVFTGGGTTFAALDAAADTVVGGSGASTVLGGGGPDIFGFINGHAGGSMVIAGLTTSDAIAFGGYADDPITS